MDPEDELMFGMSRDSWKATWVVIGLILWGLLAYSVDWLVWWWRGAL